MRKAGGVFDGLNNIGKSETTALRRSSAGYPDQRFGNGSGATKGTELPVSPAKAGDLRTPPLRGSAIVNEGGFSNFGGATGSRRIQSELRRTHDFEVSRTTIDKVLTAADSKLLPRRRLPRKKSHRYAEEVPGEPLQMDTCEIGLGLFLSESRDPYARPAPAIGASKASCPLVGFSWRHLLQRRPIPTTAIRPCVRRNRQLTGLANPAAPSVPAAHRA